MNRYHTRYKMLKTQMLAQQIEFRLEFWNKLGEYIDKLKSKLIKLNILKRLTTLNTWKGTKYHKSLRDIADFIQNLWFCNITTIAQYYADQSFIGQLIAKGEGPCHYSRLHTTCYYRSWWGLDKVSFLVCRFLFIQIVFVCLQSSLEGRRLQNRGWVLGCGLIWF